ncbi:MAG: hypothetical protein EAZ55_02040 [Cytophagales bacterium]|nr:MAG: hypothetical protein EAZ55_02040 [Cytophagales bacterium]
MKKTSLLFTLIFLCCVIASTLSLKAEDKDPYRQKIDSLKTLYGEAKTDTARITLLIHLAYVDIKKVDLALDYLIQATELAEKLKNKEYLYNAYSAFGEFYASNNNIEKGLDYGRKCLQIAEELKDDRKMSEMLYAFSEIYYGYANYEKALPYAKRGLQYSLKIKNNNTTASFHNFLGLCYLNTNRLDSGMYHLEKSLEYAKLQKNAAMEATIYNNIGMNYNKMKEYDKALSFLLKSLELEEKEYKEFVKNPTAYRKKSPETANMNEDNFLFSISNMKTNLGIIYKNKKDYAKSLPYLLESLQYAEKQKAWFILRKAYMTLYEIYENQQDPAKALENYKLYVAVSDSLDAKNNLDKSAEMENKILIEKKEKELASIKKENEIRNQQNFLINASLGTGLFLMIVLAGVVYRRYQEKYRVSKVLEEKNHEINAQNDQILEKSQKLEAAYTEIMVKNRDITDSIEYAKRIQEALLPTSQEIQQALPESFIWLKPRDIVSGDFYWITQTPDEKVVIAAIDCTGHGVPGALMSMVADAYLNQIVNMQNITEADQILNQLHKNVRKAFKQEHTESRDGMDLALCVIDKKQKQVSFAGAKNPLLYIQNNQVEIIKADRFPIGGLQHEAERFFTKHTINIAEPTTFYLFSDGIQDQFGGEKGKKFMLTNLRELLLKTHQMPMEEQKEVMQNAINEWMEKGEAQQIDDILLMGFKVGV